MSTDKKIDLDATPLIDIVFDGPPGPTCGRFVEVEDAEGCGLKRGEWVERDDGFWALRLPDPSALLALAKAQREEIEKWREIAKTHRYWDGQCFACGQYTEDLRANLPDSQIGCSPSCPVAVLLPNTQETA